MHALPALHLMFLQVSDKNDAFLITIVLDELIIFKIMNKLVHTQIYGACKF